MREERHHGVGRGVDNRKSKKVHHFHQKHYFSYCDNALILIAYISADLKTLLCHY